MLMAAGILQHLLQYASQMSVRDSLLMLYGQAMSNKHLKPRFLVSQDV